MKRSEMLKEMIDIIHTYRRNTEGVTSVNLAVMVLNKIEHLGMLPPPVMSAGEESNQAYFNNEWDPEDETLIE